MRVIRLVFGTLFGLKDAVHTGIDMLHNVRGRLRTTLTHISLHIYTNTFTYIHIHTNSLIYTYTHTHSLTHIRPKQTHKAQTTTTTHTQGKKELTAGRVHKVEA